MPSPPDPVALAVAGIDIRWYALFMLAGIIAGLALTRFLAARVGFDPDWLLDVAPWVILAAIVGARLYYVLLRAGYFGAHPWEAVNVRLGGLSFHGSLIAGTLAFFLLCRRDKQPFLAWADIVVPGVALAQAIGRWGNWANQEAFGMPTDLPWGLWIDPQHRPPGLLDIERFHPTFLYESLFDLANAVVLSWLVLRCSRSRLLRQGDLLAVYLIAYGAARFLIERLRTDSLYIGPLPAAYWLSWVLIAAGVALLVAVRRWGRWPAVSQRASSSRSGTAAD
jgi:phosphatidylglycerol:prolipoprotein diacylglycerol transferase